MLPVPLGTECAVTYRVPTANLVRYLFPDVAEFACKPDVMATGWLVGLCEWPAMEALRGFMTPEECSLGTSVTIHHRAPVVPRTELTARARCHISERRRTGWQVTVHDGTRLVADATVTLAVVELASYAERLIPATV